MAFDRPSAASTATSEINACLIVDVHLPEMNGFRLCETLAASGCRLPTIMVTGTSIRPRASWCGVRMP